MRFDVIAHTSITLSTAPDRTGYQGRSHSLWFCDAQTAEQYGWFETAFMNNPFLTQQSMTEPYAIPPESEARVAVNPGRGIQQLAWPFTRLEPGDLGDFVSRWAGWLAQAAAGQLVRPSTMPERTPQGSHR